MTFAEYLWELLSSPFKRRPDGEMRRWVDSLGHEMDQAKAAVFRMRRLWLVLSAEGQALDLIGKSRSLPRYPGESDDAYRRRLSAAWIIFSQGGTLPGMREALRLIGYPDAVIHELYKDGPQAPFHNGAAMHDGGLQHQGGVRWAEFTVRTRLEDRDVTRADMAVLMDTIFRLKPARSLPTAVAFELPFEDYVVGRDGVEIDVWFVGHALKETFPWPGRRHDGAASYAAAWLHDSVWDLSALQSDLALRDAAAAGPVAHDGQFRRNAVLRFGAHPAMLEDARVGTASRWQESIASEDAEYHALQLALDGAAGMDPTDRFPAGPTRHDGRFARSQLSRYSPDETLDRLAGTLRIGALELVPGTLAHGSSFAVHNGGGARWRHNGRVVRGARYVHDGRWHYSGVVNRRMTVFRYGDLSRWHDGLDSYGRLRVRDGAWTHGANGVVEEFAVAVKRHGQCIAA